MAHFLIPKPLLFMSILLGIVYTVQTQSLIIDSWKRGNRTITPWGATIQISAKQPEYQALVKDSSGKDRYRLSILVLMSSDNKWIGYCLVKLTGLADRKEINLLQ